MPSADDEPKQRRKRATNRRPKRRGFPVGLLIASVVGLVLLGAVTAIVVLRRGAPSVGAGGAGDEGTKNTQGVKPSELSERFVGRWEGESPARPSLKVYYEVTRDRMSLTAYNTRTREWGDAPLVSSWRTVRAQGNTLIIQTEGMESGERGEMELVFASDDAVSITSRVSGRLVGNFRRVSR